MVVGSFIAGASSEGGGAVAFPVFTLLLNIAPETARNFSLAIQSVGMTAASTMIIGLKIPIEKKAIFFASIGGVFGLVFGTFFLVDLVSGPTTKIFFVSIWLSFGFALFLINRNKDRKVFAQLSNTTLNDTARLIVFGFVGGIITSFFGNGIDIFTFCLLTLFYGIDEKVATPTSVVIMTINTMTGFLLHFFVIKDFQTLAFECWLVAIPVVVIFAPVGAYVISFFTRHTISYILYVILLVQYIGAIIIIELSLFQMMLSTLVVFAGFLFFWHLSRKVRKRQIPVLTS
jgi:uncharacterized membrane protein YfcA